MTLEPHPLRAAVLGEVHARPYPAIEPPRRILHFAFMTGPDLADKDRAAFGEFCAARGHRGPEAGAKYYRIEVADATLRWEQHSEFTTYSWGFTDAARVPFETPASRLAKAMADPPQPGPLLVSADLHYLEKHDAPGWRSVFDGPSLAAFRNETGDALVATDFRADGDGFVRILVLGRRLDAQGAGALILQLLELETYRSLCLLGLPTAQALQPALGAYERDLADITAAMTTSRGLEANRALLDRIMTLAGELEAGASRAQFRFAATRAYYELVQSRLEGLGERPVDGLQTFSAFMDRRLGPAMRTCRSVEQRQERLSDKLARAANLLRTRVDIELEQQNGELLKAMNERARLQLRLQQTVEGLSIAAISYYVVALADQLLAPLPVERLGIGPKTLKAILIIVTIGVVAWAVRSLRRRHIEKKA